MGNYTDGAVAVWVVQTGTMIAAAQAEVPINRMQWDPCSPCEFATVGQRGLLQFWHVDESQAVPVLNVHTAATPEAFSHRTVVDADRDMQEDCARRSH